MYVSFPIYLQKASVQGQAKVIGNESSQSKQTFLVRVLYGHKCDGFMATHNTWHFGTYLLQMLIYLKSSPPPLVLTKLLWANLLITRQKGECCFEQKRKWRKNCRGGTLEES